MGVVKYIGCFQEGCSLSHYGKGFCQKHFFYLKNKMDRRVLPLLLHPCSVFKCREIVYARGLCKNHYAKWRYRNRNKIYRVLNKGHKCRVPWCNLPADTRLMCNRHYMQWLHFSKIRKTPFKTPFDRDFKIKKDCIEITLWDKRGRKQGIVKISLEDKDKILKYGWNVSSQGYARNNKVGKMHRYILDLPKRIDEDDQVVDHINHNRLDNRRCNLRVVHKIINLLNHKNTTDKTRVKFSLRKKKWRANISVFGPYRETKAEALVDRENLIHIRRKMFDEIHQKTSETIMNECR